MPIRNFWCASCAKVVDADHYVPWGDCESGITGGMIRNILTHSDKRPSSGWSVTQLKGCLRSVVIERTVDVTIDPEDYLLMELGTAWDHWITRHEEAKPRWRGTLGGLEISGEPDGYVWDPIYGEIFPDADRATITAMEIGVIWDYKNGTPPRKGVWPDHRWQVSVYAFISPHTFDGAAIYYNAYGGKAGTPCKRRFDLIRDEEELLDHELYKGYTVGDNIRMAKDTTAEPAELYPLTGRRVPMGKKTLCDYCPVRDACAELDGSVGI